MIQFRSPRPCDSHQARAVDPRCHVSRAAQPGTPRPTWRWVFFPGNKNIQDHTTRDTDRFKQPVSSFGSGPRLGGALAGGARPDVCRFAFGLARFLDRHAREDVLILLDSEFQFSCFCFFFVATWFLHFDINRFCLLHTSRRVVFADTRFNLLRRRDPSGFCPGKPC